VITACGLVVSVGLVLFDLIFDRQLSAADWLLIPGIPAVALGQVWGLIVLGARHPQDVRRRWFRSSVKARPGESARRFFFEGLPKLQANGMLGIALLGWLAAMTAFPSLSSGGPASGTPGCPYRLNDHGDYRCVSHTAYDHAGAASQRFACGILAAFFSIQLGIAAAELARRRKPVSESA
jgi:hypothetical protein